MHPTLTFDLIRQDHERRLAEAAIERANTRGRAARQPSDASRRPPSRTWASILLSTAPTALVAR
ncbi:hypothetical protein [Cellulomonas soli]|uniref:Uncharacterized protein n=1 Tax=Cellulomonas soli TaxID=931535 RepID=A0A512PAZ9_9CELL|nr:hypothetical protein [Cellulomonas soli]NYI57336.1 hypothetical protein [Cellulomonas soli]GEP68384.1 hypothetical protein CSO01_10990 [Cellulomonas soli]